TGSLGSVYAVLDVTASPKPYSAGIMPNARLSAEDLLLAFTENNERKLLVTLDRLFGRYRDAGCLLEKLRLEVHDLISACLLYFQEQNIFIDALDSRRAALLSDLSATASPFALWVVLKRHLVEILRNKSVAKPQGSSMVNQVNQYIAGHYNTDISLETIARIIHVNSSYLSRLYKKETGVALTTYLNQYRIQKAKILLQTRKYTVAEVGSMVGINDPAYFTHVFTKYVGQSPKTYSQKLWGAAVDV
ncbi:MAG: AraC family transcriptional regulator, partial [Angelakisella sp.]